ncbi:hypothetical protein [Cellulosilyticum ruminicola]|uniref:hypothetical protein n=1 Tax=Cellulosilyticum ruminicola TaxID=425254 RepID=UPI001FA7AE2B|nr:hypothetical protein [Cellulosilyticum ruminicola]
MDEKTLREIALFKFSLIAPVVNNTYEGPSKSYFLENLLNMSIFYPLEKLNVLQLILLKTGILTTNMVALRHLFLSHVVIEVDLECLMTRLFLEFMSLKKNFLILQVA